jgi:hypothetical protein
MEVKIENVDFWPGFWCINDSCICVPSSAETCPALVRASSRNYNWAGSDNSLESEHDPLRKEAGRSLLALDMSRRTKGSAVCVNHGSARSR